MPKKHDIFVSYASVHADLVGPLVQLLRVSGRLIFHDKTSIEPGDIWHDKIMESLDEAKTVVVIWCSHASESQWVKKECDAAVEKKKKVVPVVLDETALPEGLSKHQWIDLRMVGGHHTKWDTASNWSNARIPSPSDDVVINAGNISFATYNLDYPIKGDDIVIVDSPGISSADSDNHDAEQRKGSFHDAPEKELGLPGGFGKVYRTPPTGKHIALKIAGFPSERAGDRFLSTRERSLKLAEELLIVGSAQASYIDLAISPIANLSPSEILLNNVMFEIERFESE